MPGIPFLSGYRDREEQIRRQEHGDLQNAGTLQGLLARMQAKQQEEELRGVMAQAGGDPAKAVQALLTAGTPKSIELASKLKGMMPRPAEDRVVNPGGALVGPEGNVKYQAPFASKEQAPSNLARLYREMSALPEGDPQRAVYKDAIIKESQTARKIVPPIVVGGGGPKSPSGFRFSKDGSSLEPIPGGPKDKLNVNLAGGRESVYVQRMMMGANQAAKDLANVVQLPLSASTGVWGGRRQGAGLFDAGKEVLANKATGQEAQAYNAMATGFQRSLAQIESAGLMPSGSLTHQMDAVLFKEGDTNLTKLHKLAQTRQIVEAGMEVIEVNPRVSKEEKDKIKIVLESVRKSVPFTHSDLIQLQVAQGENPNATLGDVIKGRGKASGGWSIRPK